MNPANLELDDGESHNRLEAESDQDEKISLFGSVIQLKMNQEEEINPARETNVSTDLIPDLTTKRQTSFSLKTDEQSLPKRTANYKEKNKKLKKNLTFFRNFSKLMIEFCRKESCDLFINNPSQHYKEFALLFLYRKLNLSYEKFPSNIENLDSTLRELPLDRLSGLSKRNEENNKFIFKHTLKLMKQQIAESAEKKLTKSELDELFVNTYFKVDGKFIISESDISLMNSFQDGSKSLPYRFYKSVFGSEKFKSGFLQIVTQPSKDTNIFISNYMDGIKNKLRKLFRRWNSKMTGEIITDEMRSEIHHYFKLNKKCKLPWTTKEIVFAIDFFLKMLINIGCDI